MSLQSTIYRVPGYELVGVGIYASYKFMLRVLVPWYEFMHGTNLCMVRIYGTSIGTMTRVGNGTSLCMVRVGRIYGTSLSWYEMVLVRVGSKLWYEVAESNCQEIIKPINLDDAGNGAPDDDNEDKDDVEVGYPPPTPPTTKKSQIYDQETFHQVEQHVRKATPDIAEDFSQLLEYLCHGLETDLAKVRAIFYWIIHQKIPLLLKQRDIPPPDTPIGYLYHMRQRKGTYSQLFSSMCRQSNVPCAVIHGLAKGIRYNVGDKMCSKLHKHSWNAVYVDGNWRLVNPHWAAMSADGYKSGHWTIVDCPENHVDNDGDGASRSYIIRPMVNDFYFLTDPDKFITKCFPNNPKWQLLAKPLTKQQFEALPFLQPAFYDLGLQLLNIEKCIIYPIEGKVEIQIQIPDKSHQRLQFIYNLFQLRDMNDEGEIDYPKLERFVLQYKKGTMIVFEIRFPPICIGSYKLEILCHDPEKSLPSEWVCDFLIVCGQGMEDCVPLPVAPRAGWGPGLPLHRHGITALTHQDGVICIDKDIFTNFSFKTKKTQDLFAELVHISRSKTELNEFVECSKNENGETVVKVKAPSEGEFALLIHCREEGNLRYNNVCNYLLHRNTVVENPSKAKIRQQLAEAIEDGDEEALSSAMQDFVENGLVDSGDLAKAKKKFLVARVNKELQDAIDTRNLDKLERTMHGISDTSLRRNLGNIVENAEILRTYLRRLKRVRQSVLEMNQKTISELRSYVQPPSAVHGVMISTYLLLGEKEVNLKKWRRVQILIGKKGKEGLKNRVATFQPITVKRSALEKSKEIIHNYDLETVQIASAGAATFYQWATSMIHEVEAIRGTAK
ncbi:hypothetical protein FSP39_023516 [Pinctada imbricata]|uniref:Kyphoscoliosis peptidase n=1 Tax=Pinctada imbricata TaxID=66713 RepID=A0AA89BWG6_PINIB|nr:hypothetical protein FSP39_023516 [Pinctada imbricata]